MYSQLNFLKSKYCSLFLSVFTWYRQ